MNLLHFLFFFIPRQIYSLNTLFYEAFTSSGLNSLGWNRLNSSSVTETSSCSGETIYGGFSIFGYYSAITNLMPLKPHSQIQLTLNFWKINSWGADNKIQIFIDGKIVYQISFIDNAGSNLCGQSNIDQKISIDQTINHNFNTALIVIQPEMQNPGGYWGINNFRLYIKECPIGCAICNEGDSAINCLIWHLVFQSLTETTTLNTDGWEVTGNKLAPTLCSNIPMLCGFNQCGFGYQIKKAVLLPPHSLLKIHFRLFKIDSWDNETATFTVDQEVKWSAIYDYYDGYQICGWIYYEIGETVEINQVHTNQDLFFEFQNNLNDTLTDESIGLRDVQIYIDTRCSNLYYYECCGDKIKQLGEDCDDGNMIPFDGCDNCKYSCIYGCILCVQGLCQQCSSEFLFNEIDNTCQIILNQIKYPNNVDNCSNNCEICLLDSCIQCIFGFILVMGQCQQQCTTDLLFTNQELKCSGACINMDYGDCLNCSEGYFLYNNQCAHLCENGDVKYINEQCYITHYDPPIYECVQPCENCQQGICLDECEYGYYQIDNKCETKCGDGIIAGAEQCDNNKGCLDCQYSCPQFCDICVDGICLECHNNYSLDFQQNSCFSSCGDHILASDVEMCDDGNQISGDGCSNKCILEKDWICDKDAECVYHEYSKFKANFVNQINEYQYVSITFTQKMMRSQQNIGPYQEFISIQLLVPGSIQYSINIIPIHEATTTLNWVNYQVEVIIQANLEYRPQIQINLQEQLYNANNLPLGNLDQIVLLNQPQYLSASQREIANQLRTTQTNLMYSFGGIGVTLLLCGFGSVVWSNLDMLQEFSYLRYINVNFPYNLIIFFDSADLIQLQNLIQKINLFFFYQYLEFEDQQANGKFIYYEINASLGINIQSFIFSLLSLFIFYMVVQQFSKFFNSISKFEENSNIVHNITFRINKIRYMTYKYGLNEMILKNGWNLLFMIFIQIKNVDSKKRESVLFFIVSILLFFGYICFIVDYAFSRRKLNLTQNQIIDAKMEILFQIKRFCFMFILIFLQSDQILQVFLLGVLYFVYLCCIIKIKKIQKAEDYKIIITEGAQMIFVITSSFYFNRAFYVISTEQKICLGWFGIGLLIFVILINLLYDFVLMLNVFIKQIQKYLEFRTKKVVTGQQNEVHQIVQIK